MLIARKGEEIVLPEGYSLRLHHARRQRPDHYGDFALGRWRRCLVRLTNHPIVANLLLRPWLFVIFYRVPFDAAKGWRRERRGVYLTNLALADTAVSSPSSYRSW
jgi:hypothetical protein